MISENFYFTHYFYVKKGIFLMRMTFKQLLLNHCASIQANNKCTCAVYLSKTESDSGYVYLDCDKT